MILTARLGKPERDPDRPDPAESRTCARDEFPRKTNLVLRSEPLFPLTRGTEALKTRLTEDYNNETYKLGDINVVILCFGHYQPNFRR